MGLPIKGIEKLSVIDYPGKSCAVVFLAGCNFRCPYCQNPDLIKRPGSMPDIGEDEVIDFLRSRKKWLDAVCISGGEPCLQPGLAEFIRKVRKEGFMIKLDTNGSSPKVLDKLLREGLVDYVAMDIKAPIEDYERVAGKGVNSEDIMKSADIIMESRVDYEFRTTVVPRLFRKGDIERIGRWLRGAKSYYVQQFRTGVTLDRSFQKGHTFSEKELRGLAVIARRYFKRAGVRS